MALPTRWSGAPVPGHNFHAQGVEWVEPLEGSARELMAIEDPEGRRDGVRPRRRMFLARHAGGRAGDDARASRGGERARSRRRSFW